MTNQPRAFEWTQTDRRAIDLIRVLAMDAVQEAGSGHPGTAMSLAPAAYLLFQHVLRHDPAGPVVAGQGPVRTVLRTLQPDALSTAVPVRLRHDPRRH